jgi:hypothetical protein
MHGGADWWVVRSFLDALTTGKRPLIDVFDAVMMTLPGLCGRESSRNGGQPVAVPQLQPRRPAAGRQ